MRPTSSILRASAGSTLPKAARLSTTASAAPAVPACRTAPRWTAAARRHVSTSHARDYQATSTQGNKLKAKGTDDEGKDVRKKDSTVHNEEFLTHSKNEVSANLMLLSLSLPRLPQNCRPSARENYSLRRLSHDYLSRELATHLDRPARSSSVERTEFEQGSRVHKGRTGHVRSLRSTSVRFSLSLSHCTSSRLDLET